MVVQTDNVRAKLMVAEKVFKIGASIIEVFDRLKMSAKFRSLFGR